MPLDFSPLWISLKTAFVATIFAFVIGIAIAKIMWNYRRPGKGLIDGILTLPSVLPPIVVGFLLLLIFGRNSPIGQLLQYWGTSILFSWQATVIGIISGTILTFARALGEFGATLMLAGSIPGKTQTMPLAIYFAAEAGKMGEALIWVIVLVAIALGVIATINYWSNTDGFFDRLRDRLGASIISRWASKISRRFSLLQSAYPIQAKIRSPKHQQLVVEIHKNFPSFSLIANLNVDEQPLGILGASLVLSSKIMPCFLT